MDHPRDNLRGILLMVAAMAGFAIEDMFIKWAAAGLPTGQILLLIGLAGAAVFAGFARMQGQRTFVAEAFHPAVLGRNAGEMIGTYGFVTALTLAPLSTVSAVAQAMPLAVTMGAALFLGETVGWRRWTAIVVGFLGVLLIIRPGLDGFDPNALWAVLAVFGLGARDLFTRKMPAAITTMQLSVWGFLAVALLGAGMLVISGGSQMPSGGQAAYVGGALAFGIAAYWALTAANRLGEMSVITPFRYSRLVFGVGIGVLVFAERPDGLTLLGGLIIIGSGLYTFARERARKRALSMQGARR
ncbi:DMT family transporter [Paragemmobacter straminiformis]|uniref:DMT family transporter n=1 Tax=Paragemmobacter straminiformis TaxID=2045119 RepID=A0A842I7J7_9RHOB|nr:DMT family transporter [Gemmobacter straminiformis]MBC2835830.1 DMT family transporter [Gemmobacter straminiformis]